MLKDAIGFSVLIAAMSVAVTAHPGHGEIQRLSGTVVRVSETVLAVDTFDPASMQRKAVSLTIDDKTKWVVGKKAGERFTLPAGHQVELLMVTEDLPDGTMRTRAVEIKVKKLPTTR